MRKEITGKNSQVIGSWRKGEKKYMRRKDSGGKDEGKIMAERRSFCTL